MLELGSGAQTALWILVVVATVATAGFTFLLEKNLAYRLRRLVPSERRKGGRPPSPRSRGLWFLYWSSVLIMVMGTALAGTAREPADDRARRALAEEVTTSLASAELRVAVAEGVIPPPGDPHRGQVDSLRRLMAPQLVGSFRAEDLEYLADLLEQELALRPFRRPVARSGELAATGQATADGLAELDRALASLNNALSDVVESLHASAADLRESVDASRVAQMDREIDTAMSAVRGELVRTREAGRLLLETLEVAPARAAPWLANLSGMPGFPEGSGHASGGKATETGDSGSRLTAVWDSLREALHGDHVERLNDEVAQADSLVRIHGDDPWHVVAGKARGLRDLGRIAEARAAFRRYGEMFSSSDPTAADYARVADAFTARARVLGLRGGLYLYAVEPEGPGWRAGLRPGDILIRLAGEEITRSEDYHAQMGRATPGTTLDLVYLRLANDGTFERRGTTVRVGPLRIGMMPI